MQIDFHFYCTAVLARAAGFSSREALLIGYCAQYVDDATESETIHIQVVSGQPAFPFEPTCTSYNPLDPLQGLGSITWGAQKRIFIPFHFIPSRPLDLNKPNLPFSYITEPHSPFAEFLLNEAVRDKHPVRRLCRIGIALHTYADTWAHRGFTGKKEPANDIERIQARDPDSGEWVPQVLENLADGIMPAIGHAEALYFPDIPYIEWRCEQSPSKVQAGGYNANTFLEAAQWMYQSLRRILGRIRASEHLRSQTSTPDLIHWQNKLVSYIPWKDLSPLIFEQLQERPKVEAGWLQQVDEIRKAVKPNWRCKNWQKAFGAWFSQPDASFPLGFDYDKITFRNDAIEGKTNWDNITPSEWKDIAPFQMALPPLNAPQTDPIETFWNKPWVQFHRGALMHRNLVAERIP